MSLRSGLPRIWYFQRITLTCRCSFPIMGSVEFKRGNWWHCLKCDAERQVIGIKPEATMPMVEKEELTRIENG